MYITNGDFVKNYLLEEEGSVDELLKIFYAVKYFLKKYGKNILAKTILSSIYEEHEGLYNIILLLNKLGKLNEKDIKNIVNLIKENSLNYTKFYAEKAPKDDLFDRIEKNVKSGDGKVKFEREKINELGISVQGEGYYYKRFLNSDIDKLLK